MTNIALYELYFYYSGVCSSWWSRGHDPQYCSRDRCCHIFHIPLHLLQTVILKFKQLPYFVIETFSMSVSFVCQTVCIHRRYCCMTLLDYFSQLLKHS